MQNVNDLNNNNNRVAQNESAKFPTVGLKSLLQNSDLLDLLLKPLSDTPAANTNANKPFDPTAQPVIETSDLDQLIDSKTKSLFDDIDFNGDYDLELKASKIANGDNDGSKIYGNAFLGPNLWDKNDLFQGEKFGVKFEYLEIDEFLNESGLNETDVELLDQLQKLENVNTNTNNNSSNNNNNNNNSNTNASYAQLQNNSNSLIPPIQSISNNNTFPVMPPIQQQQQQQQMLQPSRPMNEMGPMVPNRLNSQPQVQLPVQQQQQQQQIMPQVQQQAQQFQFKPQKEESKQSFSSGSSTSSRSSYDYDYQNEVSVDGSFSDYENFNPRVRKFTEDELKPQPILKKSKKIIIPCDMKDDKYWQRRKKNNIAAKRSRDARRMKENHIALRAGYLEKENDTLKKQLEDFKRETRLLKMKLSHYESMHGVSNPSSSSDNVLNRREEK